MLPENFAEIIVSQLMDPFRIGLLIALIFTTIRNQAATGWLVPLFAGIVFVAIMIATMMPKAEQSTLLAVGTGLVSNTIILLVLLAGLAIFRRFAK